MGSCSITLSCRNFGVLVFAFSLTLRDPPLGAPLDPVLDPVLDVGLDARRDDMSAACLR